MKSAWKVVFDTSTLVSAALREDSTPERAFRRVISSCFLCVSRETLEELETVLARAKFDRYISHEVRKAFTELVRERVGMIAVSDSEVQSIEPKCRDSNDDEFLALAKVAGVDLIVSSDEDLLVHDPWCGIRIMRPAEFAD